MKEHIDDYYFDATYIILEQHYRTWDPHLCHWSRYDSILDACVYGPHVLYLLGCTSTFMILWWGTFLMYICMMLLFTFMIYILYSWCLEGCNTSNGILKSLYFVSLGVAVWLLVWDNKPTFSCLSSSLQSSVHISYVDYLLRYGLNFHMIGVHGISSYTFHTIHVLGSYGILRSFLVSLVSILGGNKKH